jgi:MFS family permease
MPRDSQTASPAGGVLAPLRLHVFRALWLANLVSAAGTIVQGVGAAWLMTTLAGTPDLVALVQTATYLPILLLALLAGTLADLWDRRRVLLLAQFWTVLISAGLAWLSGLDLVTPATLLLFTFLIGVGTALTGPAWQASVRGIVPQGELAAAVTLNAIAMNFARAVGPAVGGAVVAAAGAGAAFYLNAACTLVLAGALLWWRHDVPSDDLPRERVGSAIVTGLRYVAEASGLRAVLARGMVFGLAASAALALLPLVARDRLAGGPLVYGFLLGAFGVGALAGAFVVHRLRRRYGAEPVLTVLAGVFGGALLVLGLVPSLLAPVAIALALAGAAWLGSFSTFNIAVQMPTAFWVQARVLALYQAAIFGSMAAGSWLWGQVAGISSLETGYLAAGSLLLLSIALHRRWRLPASEAPDLRPRQLPELKLAFPFDREAGPVMVLIEYRVPLANAAVFVRAMEEVGHVRKRDGAWRWHLFQDTADAEHWYEAFTVASWLHYLRQRRRGTAADEIVLERARRFLDPGFQPLVRRMIARGRDMTPGG